MTGTFESPAHSLIIGEKTGVGVGSKTSQRALRFDHAVSRQPLVKYLPDQIQIIANLHTVLSHL